MRVKSVELAVAAMLAAAPASAAGVVVRDAWIRALPAHLPAAGYFTLKNAGPKEAVLTSASTKACGMLMLHKSTNSGGMGSMEDVGSVSVPAGGTISFSPGGYHLMCMDPSPAIAPGGSVQVTLHFADGSQTSASFAVRNAQGK
jgi:periplasmic copper chaperone A